MGRARSGQAGRKVFFGPGGRSLAFAPDNAIQALVRDELRAVHGITAEPAFWSIYRWPRGLPQYTVGHPDRLATIERRLPGLPGVFLAGASFRGVGIPDCIQSGWAAADAATAHVGDMVVA